MIRKHERHPRRRAEARATLGASSAHRVDAHLFADAEILGLEGYAALSPPKGQKKLRNPTGIGAEWYTFCVAIMPYYYPLLVPFSIQQG